MTKKIISAIVIVIVLGAVAFIVREKILSKNAATAENNKQDAAGLSDFKLVVPTTSTEINFVSNYGKDRGFFQKNGINLEIIQAEKTPFQLVAAGQADAMFAALTRPVAAYFNGIEARQLANCFQAFGYFAYSRYSQADISNVKKVAVHTAGSESQQIAGVAMKNLGLDPNKIEYVAADSPAAEVAMLQKGDVDMAVFDSDASMQKQLANDESMKNYTMLSGDIFNEDGVTFMKSIVTTQPAIDKDPAKMQKFVTALYETLSDIKNNKAAFVAEAKQKLQMDDDSANMFYDELTKAIGEVQYVPQADSSLTQLSDSLRAGTSNPTRDITDFVYSTFAQQAVAK